MKCRALLTCISLSVLLVYALPGHAELHETNPLKTCGYLKEDGLQTRGWKTDRDVDKWWCASPYKEVGSAGNGLRNNIAYYVEGDKNKAILLKIVANINNIDEDEALHHDLVKIGNILSQKATGKILPPKIQMALSDGYEDKSTRDNVVYEVNVEEFGASSKGYTVWLIIK